MELDPNYDPNNNNIKKHNNLGMYSIIALGCFFGVL